MQAIWNAIAFLNWERNLAASLGMTHGQMKDLVTKRVIKAGMTIEQAKEALAKR